MHRSYLCFFVFAFPAFSIVVNQTLAKQCATTLETCANSSNFGSCSSNFGLCLGNATFKPQPLDCYLSDAARDSYETAKSITLAVVISSIIVPVVPTFSSYITHRVPCCNEFLHPVTVATKEPTEPSAIAAASGFPVLDIISKLYIGISGVAGAAVSAITLSWFFDLWRQYNIAQARCRYVLDSQ